MIHAIDKSWNSPTTLYIARRLQTIAKGRALSVLDMGCGDGTIIELLMDYGYDLYGYDFPEMGAYLKNRLSKYFGASYDKHLHIAKNEWTIPFDDDSFDVIYANQVFEHIKFMDRMLQECTRVLKPKGILLANFPLATRPVETHLGIPFAHWLPPGHCRVKYLSLFYTLGIRSKSKGMSAMETAIKQDLYLKERTFYRFMNEILSLFAFHFGSFQCETDVLINSKLDLMKIDKNPMNRWFGAFLGHLRGNGFYSLVTHLVNSAFYMSYPKKNS